MAGRKTFVAGDILRAQDVQDYLMDQSVMLFASSAARGTEIPSPVEGMITALADTDQLFYYTGAAYKPIASVGGSGTTTSGANLTVTHGLGTTPAAVTATVRSNTYSATLNTNIFVGNIGATTFTVFANNGASGAVAAAFNWIACA